MNSNDNQSVHHLHLDDKEITLIGTAHVSRESVELVAQVIAEETPDTVCVELCESRFQAIRQKDRWQDMDIVKVIREKKAFLLLSNLMLSAFQKKIAKKFDVKPGEEMLKAIEAAETIDARVHLADREIRITLSRAWRIMGMWEKIKMITQLLLSASDVDDIEEEDIEKMKQEDILESLLKEVEKSHPVLRSVLIDERDQYLAEKIKTAPGKKVVAVVGAGHVPGIKKYIDEHIDLAMLESLPPKGIAGSIVKWGIPTLIVAAVIVGFFYGGTQTATHMIKWWFIANGVLAGLGAIIALGHPLTIIAAICAAPLTSLNPMIAAGWVSGLVEAFISKPKVKDFESLSEDILSFRGFWRNKVTRILLVVVFTNLGSVAGTFVALPLMAKVI